MLLRLYNFFLEYKEKNLITKQRARCKMSQSRFMKMTKILCDHSIATTAKLNNSFFPSQYIIYYQSTKKDSI